MSRTRPAPTKISDIEAAFTAAEQWCKRLGEAIALMKEKVEKMKEVTKTAGP